MNNKIAIIGGIGLDTNIYTQDENLNLRTETHFQTILDNIGGTAGYTCLSYASLGHYPHIIDFVGNDLVGNYIKNTLEHSGVNLSGLMTGKEGTKRSVNLVYPNGTRNSFYDSKDSMSIRPEDLDMNTIKKIFEQTDYAHFSIVNWTRFLLDLAKKCGNTIIVDLQDIWTVEDEYRQDFIQKADVMFFSASNLHDIPKSLEQMADYNEKAIIIATDGKNRSMVWNPNNKNMQGFEISKKSWNVVDTNGAGDCFAVGFISSYYLDGYSFDSSIQRANLNAHHICTQRGHETKFLTKDELNAHFENTNPVS